MKTLKSLRTTDSANPGWLRRFVRRGQTVWINHYCSQKPSKAKYLGRTGKPTWPHRIKTHDGWEYSWAKIYPTQQSAIAALGGEKKAWNHKSA